MTKIAMVKIQIRRILVAIMWKDLLPVFINNASAVNPTLKGLIIGLKVFPTVIKPELILQSLLFSVKSFKIEIHLILNL